MLKKVSKRFFQEVSGWGWLVIMAGTIAWSLTMVKSGLLYSYGMGFWGPNGHDGVWHVALAESLARGSWQMPVFAGETIKNYHIGFDLLVAWLHKLTLIPIHNLYFQVLPPVLAFLIGYFAYKLILSWTKSPHKAFWATFFVYFGGNWGWIVTLIRDGELSGESMFWSHQSISTLINPPFALSLLLIFAGLWVLNKGLKSNDKKLLIIGTFLFGILIQIKVYAGILMLVGLFAAGFWRILKRRGISLTKVATGALIISILLFSPVTGGVQETIIFKPFWFLETMMQFPDRFYWPKLGEAMVNYRLSGNWIKGIPAYFIAFAIFWFGNLGTRVIKEVLVFKWVKNFKKMTYIEVIFATVILLGALIPMFFIQSGTPWNTIQFMYYSLMFSGVLAGTVLGSYLDKKLRRKPMLHISLYVTRIVIPVFLVVLLTVPTTIGTLKHYLPSRPPAKISNEELEALKFLSKQPDGIVLTLPFDREAAEKAIDNPPRPLYLYESTAYVSAFSGKQTYLEDEVNLEITGYDWRMRRKDVENYLMKPELGFLEERNISYIYWVKGQEMEFGELHPTTEKIFENNEIDIYRFDTSQNKL